MATPTLVEGKIWKRDVLKCDAFCLTPPWVFLDGYLVATWALYFGFDLTVEISKRYSQSKGDADFRLSRQNQRPKMGFLPAHKTLPLAIGKWGFWAFYPLLTGVQKQRASAVAGPRISTVTWNKFRKWCQWNQPIRVLMSETGHQYPTFQILAKLVHSKQYNAIFDYHCQLQG